MECTNITMYTTLKEPNLLVCKIVSVNCELELSPYVREIIG